MRIAYMLPSNEEEALGVIALQFGTSPPLVFLVAGRDHVRQIVTEHVGVELTVTTENARLKRLAYELEQCALPEKGTQEKQELNPSAALLLYRTIDTAESFWTSPEKVSASTKRIRRYPKLLGVDRVGDTLLIAFIGVTENWETRVISRQEDLMLLFDDEPWLSREPDIPSPISYKGMSEIRFGANITSLLGRPLEDRRHRAEVRHETMPFPRHFAQQLIEE